jgi:hypothetical protein
MDAILLQHAQHAQVGEPTCSAAGECQTYFFSTHVIGASE